ncbi:MAG: 2-C-methyl-D-erythritol 2,4-cyclodiphosphate synthase [Clostridia bacterium]|nr:2-C-methyl-D-erythritol 2,4-cyclodiphosphate synthase [Clostridia bacterium]MBQ1942144.1 2-C-methyl-D-erythritol 2,4-cyclodiphosphate synthase [Clostridia bacterium]MBQ5801886.1 2-C-methyl-D-erythritol 2,4-cyclodiphosphate synthase [Clostridia bacterium]
MPAKTCDGEYENKKLTYKTDFDHEELSRTGIGYDTHQLVEGRKLILGGVEIPHEKGLLGHSDADVLIHAVMDALLTAAGLPDIGHLFPDTDPKYKDIASTLLLSRVMEKIEDEGYKVVNVSAVIMAEKPKLAPYLDKIIHNLSQIIHISTSAVGISCTTTEKLGFVGREEGIASCATVLLRPER